MKRICLTAALAFACSAALAQTPAPDVQVPKLSCDPKPVLPMIKDPMVQRVFDRDLRAYKDCVKAYVDAREATIKANQAAANKAIDDYNSLLTSLKDQSTGTSGASSDPKKY